VRTAFEESVEDRFSEIAIMEQLAESGQRFVGGDDHGAAPEIAIVDDTVRTGSYSSARSASIGSTPSARLVGTMQAKRHTPNMHVE
jgi:hypothetical protein